MSGTTAQLVAGLVVIGGAVYAVLRKVDVRLALLPAALALGEIGPGARGSVPALRDAVLSKDAGLRIEAGLALIPLNAFWLVRIDVAGMVGSSGDAQGPYPTTFSLYANAVDAYCTGEPFGAGVPAESRLWRESVTIGLRMDRADLVDRLDCAQRSAISSARGLHAALVIAEVGRTEGRRGRAGLLVSLRIGVART